MIWWLLKSEIKKYICSSGLLVFVYTSVCETMHYLFFKIHLVIWKGELHRERERDKERDLPSVYSFLKWLRWSGVGQVESQNQKHQPGLPLEWQGSKSLGRLSLPFKTHWQGAGWEVEQSGFRLVLISDASTPSGSWTSCATMPAPDRTLLLPSYEA